MSDLGHDIELGLFLTPDAARPHEVLELALLAEVAGLDLVTVQDHPYQAAHLDAWTLLSVVAARTSTVRVAPNVANLPLRSPVLLARAAASLDLLSGGRVELGLGTGAFWDAIVAAGGPRRTPREAVDALVEALAVIDEIWAGETVRVNGEHYRVNGLHGGPVPSRPIPVWLGAYGPRMLQVTGRLADAWVPSMGYADPPALPAMSARVDEAAVAAGRSPADVRRIYNLSGRFGTGSGFVQGSPGNWAEQLAELALEHGFSTFVLGTDDPDTVRRFGAEVAPALRQLVAQGREARHLPSTVPEPAATAPVTGAGARGPLLVSATPDDGTRLRPEQPWVEHTRPTTTPGNGHGNGDPADLPTYGPAQQAAPQHLVDIHDGLRAELEQLRDVVGQVQRGRLSAGRARSVINTMALRQNAWSLGAFCASYCRIVTTHHTLEDRSIFPHLRETEPGLGPVLDRLEEEHEVIADVLDRLDRALVAMIEAESDGPVGDEAVQPVQHAVDLLHDTLRSHLSYEERELIHPLARRGFG